MSSYGKPGLPGVLPWVNLRSLGTQCFYLFIQMKMTGSQDSLSSPSGLILPAIITAGYNNLSYL